MSTAPRDLLLFVRSPVGAGRLLPLALAGLSLLSLACQRGPSVPPRAAGSTGPVAGAAPAVEGLPMPPGAPPPVEETRPVYPSQLDGAESPQAQTLCRALHELPAARRKACCQSTTGLMLNSDCVRVLTFAQRSGAVRIDEPALASCVAGLGQLYSGCDWIGPWPPELPAECRGVLHGTLAAGARCRSSLECQEGLFCHGAGPTASGVCGVPRVDGERCGLAVDALAAYLRMSMLTEPHPQFAAHRECAGVCNLRHVCESLHARGESCVMSVQCGADDRCGRGQCIAGRVAGPGQACSGGDCAAGLRCFGHVCQAPKPAGASCGSDFECQGGCEKPAGAERGVCAMTCSRG